MTAATLNYRADIDGLRAVAVLSVITFHVDRTWLPGGFLGVDVFFVISGFLITTILAREIAARQFSLWRFYERRLRRIGPALLAVLLASSAGACLVLLPVDLLGFARSLLATLGFVSNVYFWRDTDYFSRAAGEKPLLHTWSLGIEEQFYILFPLLLWLAYRRRRQWAGGLIAVLTLGSLAAAVVALKIGAGLPAFYLLPTRAWELGAGALLVFARPSGRAGKLASVAAAAGLGAVVAGLVVDPAAYPMPLPAAMLPVAGSALLIWSGRGATPAPNRLLAGRVPVLIGRMSYSLYLWHWPILVLARYVLVRDATPAEGAGLVGLIAVAGLGSWRFVETPFRDRRRISTGRLLLVCGAGVALLSGVAAAILIEHGFPGRLNAQAARINAAVGTNYRCPIADYLAFGASRGCVLNLPSRDPADADVVLLGNSHAQMYAPLIGAILRTHGLRGLLVPANGCLPWTATNIDAACRTVAGINLAAVVRLPARVVIIGFNWSELDGDLVDAAGHPVRSTALLDRVRPLDATIAALRAAGKRVIVIGPVAEPGWDIASILSRDLAFGRPIDRPDFAPAAAFVARYGPVVDAFAARRDIAFVRPDRVQCTGSRCAFVVAGTSLFADDNHLAAASLGRFRRVFEPAIVAAAAR